MKPMIWHPEERDVKVNQYLDSFNREPVVLAFGMALLLVSAFTIAILVGIL